MIFPNIIRPDIQNEAESLCRAGESAQVLYVLFAAVGIILTNGDIMLSRTVRPVSGGNNHRNSESSPLEASECLGVSPFVPIKANSHNLIGSSALMLKG